MARRDRLRKGLPVCPHCGRRLQIAFTSCGSCGGTGSVKGVLGFKRRCSSCAGKGHSRVPSYSCPVHPGLLCWRCSGTGAVGELGMEAPCPVCRARDYEQWKRKFTAPPGYVYGQPPYG